MDKVTYELEGFAELERQLIDLAEGYRSDLVARNTLVKSAKIAMEPVLQSATVRAPYDEKNISGIHLRETLRLDARIPTDKDRLSEYVNDTDAAIAVVSAKKSAVSLSQEFGNAVTVAQPFLRIALESNAAEVLRVLGRQISSHIIDYTRTMRNRKLGKWQAAKT